MEICTYFNLLLNLRSEKEVDIIDELGCCPNNHYNLSNVEINRNLSYLSLNPDTSHLHCPDLYMSHNLLRTGQILLHP